jgi:hypothetical protein
LYASIHRRNTASFSSADTAAPLSAPYRFSDHRTTARSGERCFPCKAAS